MGYYSITVKICMNWPQDEGKQTLKSFLHHCVATVLLSLPLPGNLVSEQLCKANKKSHQFLLLLKDNAKNIRLKNKL